MEVDLLSRWQVPWRGWCWASASCFRDGFSGESDFGYVADGKLLVSEWRLRAVDTGKPVFAFQVFYRSYVRAVSKDGSTLVSSSWLTSDSVRIWDLKRSPPVSVHSP